MSDRSNRIAMAMFASILVVGGGLTVAYGRGAFGHHRASAPIIDATTVHQWERFGARSFAAAGALGLVLLVVGCALAIHEWRRNDGNGRTADFSLDLPRNIRGTTVVHAPSLSHTLERDLRNIPDVQRALVGLFGAAPSIELRSVITVDDCAEMESLVAQVDSAVDRFTTTVGFRPNPVQVTVRYTGSSSPSRQLQ